MSSRYVKRKSSSPSSAHGAATRQSGQHGISIEGHVDDEEAMDDEYEFPLRRRRNRTPLWNGLMRVRRTWNLIIFGPLAIAVVMAELVRMVLAHWQRDQPDEHPTAITFRRPRRMPKARGERSVAQIVEKLRQFPFRPMRIPARVAFTREFGTDGIGMMLSAESAIARLPQHYPGCFKPCLLEGADGVHLSGMVAMHESSGPALIICHGLMTSKYFDYIREMATRAYSDWGFHVALIDLRGFGQSVWTTDAPSALGYKEGLDVVEVARFLHDDDRVTTVGALGYSLGGATVLNAAHAASAEDPQLLDGGVLSVCAPTDMRVAIDHISRRPPLFSAFFGVWLILRASLQASARRAEIRPRPRTWIDVVEATTLPYYGYELRNLYNLASASRWGDEITVPTLALHADDDFLVPVEHAHKLATVSAANPQVAVWTVARGNHCAFPALDERWFHSVLRRWFEYWADEPQ